MDTLKIPQGLGTSVISGLQEKYGPNAIEEKFDSTLKRLTLKFIGPIPLMIEAALFLSFISGKWEDFTIIGVLLLINVSVDFFQEQKAHKALDALRDTLSTNTLVMRDGRLFEIPAREIVPGDIIKLSIGEIIPADAVIVQEQVLLYVDQSQITGEALPVEKESDDKIFSGSIVQRGEAYARVTAIGKDSALGKNAALVAKASREKKGHFEKAIVKISRFLIISTAIIIFFVFILLLARGESPLETSRFVLVLLVASIPVALPAVLSVTMAIGASKLAKKQVIVSHFKALEELASIDVLCTDKTGTVTQNKLTVELPEVYGAHTLESLLFYSKILSSQDTKNTINQALLDYSLTHGDGDNHKQVDIVKYTPFDPRTKTSRIEVVIDGEEIVITMGATQAMINLIDEKEIPESMDSQIEDYASKGFKTIALGIQHMSEKNPIIIGLIPFYDPPRDDSKETINTIKKAGITIKMLTGDHTAIARYIGKLLGLGTGVMHGRDIGKPGDTQKTEQETQKILQTDIFTEVAPEHKYQIIDILQNHDHIVAMTGDGVNDAPALKKADIGIAVRDATPAARAAADLVLLTDGLSVIELAIEHARMIFARMLSYATFRISETIRIVLFITLAIIIFDYSPLSAITIILLALLNDIPVMAIAYDNAPIAPKPMRWHLSETLFIAVILGVSGLVASFALFYWLNINGFSIAIIQSILFLKLDVSGHSTLYLTRTGRKHFWEKPYPSLKFFIPAFGSRMIGTVIVLTGLFIEQLSVETVIYVWIYATIWFVVNDFIKVKSYKLYDVWREKRDKKITEPIAIA